MNNPEFYPGSPETIREAEVAAAVLALQEVISRQGI